MAPAIAHFLVGAGAALLLAAPVVLRYDIDHSWGLWLVPFGGLWGLFPDVHNISSVYRAQLHAIHYSPWMDLFALHYSLDRPTIRGMYLESVFGSILFFLLAVGAFSVAQSLRGRIEATEPSLERGLLVAGGTITAIGYSGAGISVIVFHLDRYPVLAALIGREGLLAGWLVLAGLSILAGIGLAGGLERLATVRNRTEPVDRIVFGGLVAIVGWLLASFVAPLWLRYLSGISVRVPYFDGRNLFVIGAFAGGFTLVYSLVRGEPTDCDRTARRERPLR